MQSTSIHILDCCKRFWIKELGVQTSKESITVISILPKHETDHLPWWVPAREPKREVLPQPLTLLRLHICDQEPRDYLITITTSVAVWDLLVFPSENSPECIPVGCVPSAHWPYLVVPYRKYWVRPWYVKTKFNAPHWGNHAHVGIPCPGNHACPPPLWYTTTHIFPSKPCMSHLVVSRTHAPVMAFTIAGIPIPIWLHCIMNFWPAGNHACPQEWATMHAPLNRP